MMRMRSSWWRRLVATIPVLFLASYPSWLVAASLTTSSSVNQAALIRLLKQSTRAPTTSSTTASTTQVAAVRYSAAAIVSSATSVPQSSTATSAIVAPAAKESTLAASSHLSTLSIGGYVYLDSNRNKSRDKGERPIKDATIALYSTSDPSTPVAITYSGSDGSFRFTTDVDGHALLPGYYNMVEYLPPGFSNFSSKTGNYVDWNGNTIKNTTNPKAPIPTSWYGQVNTSNPQEIDSIYLAPQAVFGTYPNNWKYQLSNYSFGNYQPITLTPSKKTYILTATPAPLTVTRVDVPVPEPGSLALITISGLGLMGWGLLRCRRRLAI